MLQAVAGRHSAAVLAALALVLCPRSAAAQAVDPLDEVNRPLDPSAPLEPWDDLDVPWPDMAEEAPGEIAAAPEGEIADAAATRRYSYRITGIDEAEQPELLARFRDLSTLEEYRHDPANAAQIDRRARADAELIAELLRAFGHYDVTVGTQVEAAPDGDVQVTLAVVPGPLYRFSEVRLPGLEAAAGADAEALRQSFAVAEQDPVDAGRVQAAQAALRAELGRRGYAFAEVGEPDVLVDHDTRTATLVMPVEPAGARRFGSIAVEGNPPFGAGHVETIARFDEGDPWRTDRIEDLRQALVATGLVSSVTIRPVAREGTDLVDLAIALEPAPMRTIAAEAGYGTGEGIRLEASWQHRNLLPPEGAVTFRGVAGTREQSLSASLRRNNFRRRDQVLTAQIAAANVDRPAFNARTFVVAGGIERQTNIIWQKNWTWSAGVELTASDERDIDIDSGTIRRRTFFIGALPLFLGYDGSNDLLDPTSGFRLGARLSPEASLQDGSFFYARLQIDGSYYQPVTDRVTIAGRVRLGTIAGASRDRIAPSRRFYAGGGGSVRGYGFQRIGPRDPVFDDPIGGRSLAEFALEARVRFGNFGIVPFVDGGNISTASLPKFDNLRFGAGIGVRYHTRFGPIRLDVATPINPVAGDPRIAVYVSLGQAF
ncbi:MAG: BamA/TamA family outer membrane protein [Sphingomonas sp.]|nr:BamA/TamA family outer membrane protein [Sphingomonas sp.]